MQIEVRCPSCGGPMLLEAKESAGQEIIDRLTRLVVCNKCIRATFTGGIPLRVDYEYRKPYAD